MSTITLLGHDYSYTITRKLIRSLSIRIHSRRTFSVSAPHLTPAFYIERFINEHSAWIVKNSSKITKKKTLKSLKTLKIVDKEYKILITKSKMDSVVIFKEEQKIYANSTALTNIHLKKLFDTRFRPFALSIISEELKKLSQEFGFSYSRVSVKNTTSRFGSCSSRNNLNFNWQIIFLPYPIFRHILLHELSHTVHHNHSNKFWSHLAACDPDWRVNRRYLKAHASSHFII
ncbi:M48 family metallopeptidase [Candidatus Shapirobacteria bacterium]|nr:M48 family metallopeptidase [Candidatus Shapirobacteria bacterium]